MGFVLAWYHFHSGRSVNVSQNYRQGIRGSEGETTPSMRRGGTGWSTPSRCFPLMVSLPHHVPVSPVVSCRPLAAGLDQGLECQKDPSTDKEAETRGVGREGICSGPTPWPCVTELGSVSVSWSFSWACQLRLAGQHPSLLGIICRRPPGEGLPFQCQHFSDRGEEVEGGRHEQTVSNALVIDFSQ